jgi:hypothetical protein
LEKRRVEQILPRSRGMGGGAQTVYSQVSKCKNDKRRNKLDFGGCIRRKYYVLMFENRKMIPVETVPGMGGGG